MLYAAHYHLRLYRRLCDFMDGFCVLAGVASVFTYMFEQVLQVCVLGYWLISVHMHCYFTVISLFFFLLF